MGSSRAGAGACIGLSSRSIDDCEHCKDEHAQKMVQAEEEITKKEFGMEAFLLLYFGGQGKSNADISW